MERKYVNYVQNMLITNHVNYKIHQINRLTGLASFGFTIAAPAAGLGATGDGSTAGGGHIISPWIEEEWGLEGRRGGL